MMCQSSGRPPTSTMGLGRNSVSPRSRLPRPPQRITTFIPGTIPRGSASSAEVKALDLGIDQEVAARAFEAVPAELQHVGAVGDGERAGGVLLDQHQGV